MHRTASWVVGAGCTASGTPSSHLPALSALMAHSHPQPGGAALPEAMPLLQGQPAPHDWWIQGSKGLAPFPQSGTTLRGIPSPAPLHHKCITVQCHLLPHLAFLTPSPGLSLSVLSSTLLLADLRVSTANLGHLV